MNQRIQHEPQDLWLCYMFVIMVPVVFLAKLNRSDEYLKVLSLSRAYYLIYSVNPPS